jgi:hypothetical protein
MKAEVVWKGKLVEAKYRRAAATGVWKAAEEVLGNAVDLAPIEEGTLAGSGQVLPPQPELRMSVSFGGEASAYAVRQHEELSWQHDAGKQAKYLEQPLNEARAMKTLERLVAAEIKKLG